jgi:hypothetical protein
VLAYGVRLALALVVASGGLAHADEDLFGLKKQPTQTASQVSCDDAHGFGCAYATDPFDDVAPFALRTWLPAAYLLHLPIGDARHDQITQYAVGATRDDAGLSFGGATGLENRWTVEGAPGDNVQTGNFDTRVPVTFLDGLLVQAGGFAARDRTSTGGTIDAQLKTGTKTHEVEAYVWSGLTAPGRARPIQPFDYQLRRLGVDAGPELDLSVVATGPLRSIYGGRTWYAVGLAPSLARTDFAWSAARRVDANNDKIPDSENQQLTLDAIEDTEAHTLDYIAPYMARTGWQKGPHELVLTGIGHLARTTFMFANATAQAAGRDRTNVVADGIATWRGRWPTTHARVQLAWHRSALLESAHDDRAADKPQLQASYIGGELPDDPAIAIACFDGGDDPYPKITNCPIPRGFFRSNGAGLLTDLIGDRPTATADLAHRRGPHVLRAGATLEDTRLITRARYTGGELRSTVLPDELDHAHFYTGFCDPAPGGACSVVGESELTYRTRYSAAYVEDTFELSPELHANGGVRWELMWVGTRLHFSNELAPRAGLTWTRGTGAPQSPQQRLWASMGRSHVMLPAGMGPILIARDKVVHDIDLFGTPLRDTDSGAVYDIAPGIEPAAQDEFTVGYEIGIAGIAHATAWWQRRSLRRGYENVLGDPDTFAGVFDNPGRDGRQPATRETSILAAEVAIAASTRMQLRAGVMIGSATGSWTGPFDPRQGAVLYAGTEYDLDATNLVGPLPTDPGKRAFLEFERRGRLAGIEVAAATRLTVQSGKPRDVLADSSELGTIYLLPRGAGGRELMLSQANVRLAARWRETDITLDVFDVFDRRIPTTTNPIYATGGVAPIVNGTTEDLVFLTDTAGRPARRDPGFRYPLAYQPPLSALLGIHRAF